MVILLESILTVPSNVIVSLSHHLFTSTHSVFIEPEKFHDNRYKQIKSTSPRLRVYLCGVFS